MVFGYDTAVLVLDMDNAGTDGAAPLGIVESNGTPFMKGDCGFKGGGVILGLDFMRSIVRHVFSVENGVRLHR
jgi:hypothetical protein